MLIEWIDDKVDPESLLTPQNLYRHQVAVLTNTEPYFKQYVPISFGTELPVDELFGIDPLTVYINNGKNRLIHHIENALGLSPDLIETQVVNSEENRASLILIPYYQDSRIYVFGEDHPVFDWVLDVRWLSLGSQPLARFVIDTIVKKIKSPVTELFRTAYDLKPDEVKIEDKELLVKWSNRNETMVREIKAWLRDTKLLGFDVNDDNFIYSLMELANMFGASVWNNCLIDATLFPNYRYLILSTERAEFDYQFFLVNALNIQKRLPVVKFGVDFPSEYDHYSRIYSASLAYELAREINPALPLGGKIEVYTNYVKMQLSHVKEMDLIRLTIKKYRNLVAWTTTKDEVAALYYVDYLRQKDIYPVLRYERQHWIIMYDNTGQITLPALYLPATGGKNDAYTPVKTPEFAAFTPKECDTDLVLHTVLPPISFTLVPEGEKSLVVASWFITPFCPRLDPDGPVPTQKINKMVGYIDPMQTQKFIGSWIDGLLLSEWGRSYWNYNKLPSRFLLLEK